MIFFNLLAYTYDGTSPDSALTLMLINVAIIVKSL